MTVNTGVKRSTVEPENPSEKSVPAGEWGDACADETNAHKVFFTGRDPYGQYGYPTP